MKKSGLGRGLKALLDDDEVEQIDVPSADKNVLFDEINIADVEVNPFQPRQTIQPEALQELTDSIIIHGIIQPVTVRKIAVNQYQLISGERRFQASRKAGLKTIPAFIRTADDQQMLEMSLIENIQRENLNPIEIALSYQRLLTECNLKQEELGIRVGKNRSTVTNFLRLLKLPPDIQIAVRDNVLTMGHARALISIEVPDSQLYVFKRAVEEELSVRQVEDLVRSLVSKKKPKVTPSTDSTLLPNRELVHLQGQLSSHFGTKIKIKSDGKKGEIHIPFLSVEDLNRILDILKI